VSSWKPLRVTVIGGGFAAAEVLLASRALAEDRVELQLVTPDTRLAFRPAAPGEPFGAAQVETYDLAQLAADVGATIRHDTAESVAPQAHRVRLASGATVDYDAAVIAIGARATAAVPGAVMFRDGRDAHHVRRIADALDAGEIRRVAYTAPAAVAWTLPLYELALLTAERGGEVVLATPETRALEVFGPAVSDQVESMLADRDVRIVRGSRPLRVSRGRLHLADGVAIAADRTVAIPRLVGRTLSGVPADWNGFVHTDAWGHVADLPDLFAAGDVTDYPVKQGGLATQQADVVAGLLARRAGAVVDVPAHEHVLRTRLFGADGPLYLRAELDASGRPTSSEMSSLPAEDPVWWPAAKLFGRYVTPWLATARPAGASASPLLSA
jgi:sulfide:quinone oxidoreductase